VFKDLGIRNAEEHLVKAQLVFKIDRGRGRHCPCRTSRFSARFLDAPLVAVVGIGDTGGGRHVVFGVIHVLKGAGSESITL
jgi:hypothetical protein